MEQILITGARGLIGSHLVPALTPDYCVDRLLRPEHAAHGIALDLGHEWQEDQLPTQVDNVIYLAQSEHFRNFPAQAEDMLQVNTLSALRLLEYARQHGCKRFIYASSGGVYGPSEAALREDKQLRVSDNLGFYLSTKLCAEILLENYSGLMDIIILRFFFVYGPGQRPDMLIPRLIQRVRQGQPIVLQGSDGIRLNPTWVGDAVMALQQAVKLTGSHKINVGGPEVLSLHEIGLEIGRQLDCEPIFTCQAGEPAHLVADISRQQELLGAPQSGFAQGLSRLLSARL
ncbi:MAG: NAD(P)-dependent oxidoreductase [Candidatus Melainabacteria bacterium HGW-Melainabacteria-1]|nr:MAG: NAD(P)-dependent oxidoreductase [Candidatus Melainabacteria bacterium HGW-Melainabacteria-1]